MASDKPHFTLRIHPDLLKKLHWLADYNGRSANKEIEMLIRRHVAEHEKQEGEIPREEYEQY